MKTGDFVLVYQDSNHISDIGLITSNYFHDYGTSYPHKRKIVWLKEFKSPFNISEYDNLTATDIRSFYNLKQIDFSDLRDIMQIDTSNIQSSKPYFLIIDNIDKGDIFSIFGESFSILDKEKRDNQFITLYLSGKKFSLPSNLYIIGTSENIIKDLSIQKRFAFIKTNNYKGSKKIRLKNGSYFDLSSFLNNINEELKANNQSILGYSFIENINTIEEFDNLKTYKLIPYFESLNLNTKLITDFQIS